MADKAYAREMAARVADRLFERQRLFAYSGHDVDAIEAVINEAIAHTRNEVLEEAARAAGAEKHARLCPVCTSDETCRLGAGLEAAEEAIRALKSQPAEPAAVQHRCTGDGCSTCGPPPAAVPVGLTSSEPAPTFETLVSRAGPLPTTGLASAEPAPAITGDGRPYARGADGVWRAEPAAFERSTVCCHGKQRGCLDLCVCGHPCRAHEQRWADESIEEACAADGCRCEDFKAMERGALTDFEGEAADRAIRSLAADLDASRAEVERLTGLWKSLGLELDRNRYGALFREWVDGALKLPVGPLTDTRTTLQKSPGGEPAPPAHCGQPARRAERVPGWVCVVCAALFRPRETAPGGGAGEVPRAICTHPSINEKGDCRSCRDNVALGFPVEFAQRMTDIVAGRCPPPAPTRELPLVLCERHPFVPHANIGACEGARPCAEMAAAVPLEERPELVREAVAAGDAAIADVDKRWWMGAREAFPDPDRETELRRRRIDACTRAILRIAQRYLPSQGSERGGHSG